MVVCVGGDGVGAVQSRCAWALKLSKSPLSVGGCSGQRQLLSDWLLTLGLNVNDSPSYKAGTSLQ